MAKKLPFFLTFRSVLTLITGLLGSLPTGQAGGRASIEKEMLHF